MANSKRTPTLAALWSSRLLLLGILAAAAVLGAFLTVLTGSWLGLGGALVGHLAATLWVVRSVLSMVGDVDAPSPTERARLEARGVLDPDRELNERQSDRQDGRVRRLFREESGDAPSTEEQQSAWTPAPSRRVGDELKRS